MRRINLPYFLSVIFCVFAAIPLFILISDWISAGLGYGDTLPISMLVPVIFLLVVIPAIILVSTLIITYNISSIIQALLWKRKGYTIANLCIYPFWIRFDDKTKIQIKISALLAIFLMPTIHDLPQVNFVDVLQQDKKMKDYARDYREASLWQLRTQLVLMLLLGLVAGIVGQWVVATYFFLLGILILDLAFVEVPQCHGTLTRIRYIQSGNMGDYLYWQIILLTGEKEKIYMDFQNTLSSYDEDNLSFFKLKAMKHLFMEACLDEKIVIIDATLELATKSVKSDQFKLGDRTSIGLNKLDLLKSLMFYAMIHNKRDLLVYTIMQAKDLMQRSKTSCIWDETTLWRIYESLVILGEDRNIKWEKKFMFRKYRHYRVFDNYVRVEQGIETKVKMICSVI